MDFTQCERLTGACSATAGLWPVKDLAVFTLVLTDLTLNFYTALSTKERILVIFIVDCCKMMT